VERDATLAGAIDALLGLERGSAPDVDPELSEWLAGRGLIRVQVAAPEQFVMPGRFLARFPGGWAVMFGVPSGPIFDPTGVASAGPPLEVSVLAPLELPPLARHAAPEPGRVLAIGIAAGAEAPMRELEEATALAGRGLEGDRYAAGAGTFSSRRGAGRDLTLVSAEAIESLREDGVAIEPLAARRNLVVSGIDLDALIGRRFQVGEAICFGARRCEPCAHLQRLTRPGVLRGLVHRGGLRADVLGGGVIRRGDEVLALD
jgi:MOSC domain-containing protein YiiM